MVWAIKHQSIGHAFFDAGAATFFLSSLEDWGPKGGSKAEDWGPERVSKSEHKRPIRKQQKYVLDRAIGRPCEQETVR